ncbi:MAG: NAD(P)-binding protein [Proteobacteria bacterium]|nr:NAD(P)-binding protein [Pseudomonadota bacterium]
MIIGAGLAGLATAYRLRRGFRLLELRDRPGGLCETAEEDGFRFDRTGHLLHLGNSKIRKLVKSLLDEPPLEIERKSRIFSHGVYTHYPFQANTYGLPGEVVAECLSGFIRAIAQGGGVDVRAATFEEFILRHFGSGIAKHFMIPYNTKLWGVHPREITSEWCRRFVPIPKIEEVAAGAVGLTQEKMGYNARFLYPRTGIEELPNAFARKVGSIEYRTVPKAIDHKRHRMHISGEWVDYQTVVSTIPLKSLVKLLVDPPKRILSAAQRLRCSSLRYLDVALDCPAGTDYHWTYVPERKYPFYRVGCYSNFSQRMAPPNKSNLYVELASRSPINLNKLMPRVSEGLIEMGIISNANQIVFARPRHLSHAYVVYDTHWDKAVPMLLSWLEKQRIFCAGRYARWEYSSMEDALIQGFGAAQKIKDL